MSRTILAQNLSRLSEKDQVFARDEIEQYHDDVQIVVRNNACFRELLTQGYLVTYEFTDNCKVAMRKPL